jgi:hypothetical protein
MMGVQPVAIGRSDSAELDKFQWQRDRSLHQIQCFAQTSDKATLIFVLSISRIRTLQRKGPGAFGGGTLLVVCLFAREATKEQAKKANQRHV